MKPERKTLVIVWHSRTGAAKALANHMYQSACAATPTVEVRQIPASACDAEQLLHAHGVIFCAPENLGALSGAMKELFDQVYYGLLDQCPGKPYALVITAGSDGFGAIRQAQRILTGLRWRAMAEPLRILTHAQSKEKIEALKQISADDQQQVRELAQAFALGLEMGIF